MAALCDIFQVTTDYLLKPSEIDALSIKTEMLEKQQKSLENAIRKKEITKRCILGSAAIYLVAFAVIMLVRQITWGNDFLWNILPGVTLPVIVLCVATAAAIFYFIKFCGRIV